MSLINQLAKLAGVTNHETVGYSSQLTEGRGDADVSKDEVKLIRVALISTVKHLEQEARDTQRSSLTALYKKDADAYDDILGALLKNSRATAKRIWDKQDTGCRDHVFDVTKDPETRQAIAKYFGVTLNETERGHLQFRVYLKFGDKWERWEAFASEGKAHEEGKNEVKTSSATEYKVKNEGVSESDESEALARKQGMKAGRTGGSNPYDKGTKEYNEWEDGFDEGKADRRGGYGMQESEQLDEISASTMKSYAKKALDDVSYNSFDAGNRDATDPERLVSDKKAFKRQKGVEKAIDKLAKKADIKEADEVKMTQLDDEQEVLSKQDDEQDASNKVPPAVFSDIAKKLKEIKFKVEHLSHIDSSYQEHGYWARFIVEMEKIVDMLKQGTDEAFKEVATKLQQFENVALAEVPDSLWKFVSSDMHKPTEKRGQSLSNKFQEVKQSMSFQGLNDQVKGL